MQKIIFIICFLVSSCVFAFEFPKNLSFQDQKKVIGSLSIQSQKKQLSDPAPLGGYKGWEALLSVEALSLSELNSIDPSIENSEFLFLPRLQLAKGIYYDIDLSLYFSPLLVNKDIKDFGGQFRWLVLENFREHYNLSLSFQVNSTNYKDILFSTNLGFDLIVSRMWELNSLAFGYGFIRNTSRIVGTSSSVNITSSGQEVAMTENNMHLFASGTHWWNESLYGTLHFNFYESAVVSSLALGVRY